MGISVQNLTKVYGEQKAVDHISFEAKPGEILGFLGPNGAGKSTTMKISTAYIPPTSGKVEVCGFDVVNSSMDVKKRVGYLPEHNPLYLDMYVKEYLEFAAEVQGVKGKNVQKRISEIIDLVGLEREQNKLIGALSKGYRQRVGLGQALIHDPEVLILDEPTTGLDPNQISEIRDLIKNISKDKTVMLSTHIMQEVQALCDRAVIINRGKIVTDKAVAELQEVKGRNKLKINFVQQVEESFFSSFESILELERLDDGGYELVTDIQSDIRPALFQKAVEEKKVIIELVQHKMSLEEAFYELTKK